MTVAEAIALLTEKEMFLRTFAKPSISIAAEGGNPASQTKQFFLIHEEENNWVASFNGPGQFRTLIRISSQLEDVVHATCDFFNIADKASIDSQTLLIGFWNLQTAGLVPAIVTADSIECRKTKIRTRQEFLMEYELYNTGIPDTDKFILDEKNRTGDVLCTIRITELGWHIELAPTEHGQTECFLETLEEAVSLVVNINKNASY